MTVECDGPGGVTYWDWTLTPVSSSAGQVEGLVLALNETTERKRAEENLQLAARVFECAGEGIMVTDTKRRIVNVNAAFTAITGYEAKEVIGRTPAVLSSGRQSPEFYRDLWRVLTIQGRWQGEIWNRRKNGEVYPEWLTISAVYSTDNNLINYVGIFSDISSIKESQQRIEYLANHDELTTLPSRHLFYDRIERAIAHGRRESSTFAVLFVDIDNFKVINDSLGHDAGDQLLKVVALRLTECVREEDTVARFGGDEFAVVLWGADAHAAGIAAGRICECLAPTLTLAKRSMHVRASIGISVFPADGTDATTLLKHADSAMYLAKDSGKATYRFYTSELNRVVNDRLILEHGLRDAIEREQMFLLYQPQFDLVSKRMIGVETLLRWQHPELGLVPPDRFIPIAESNGIINMIGDWIAESVGQQMAAWRARGLAIPRVSINVSPAQLRHVGLTASLEKMLARHCLSPRLIMVELTESALMVSPEQAQHLLHELKALGIALSIDDFGTGYSSLSCLRRFPLDELKIDRSFVDEVASNGDDRAIAQTIIGMARSLGLSVVAEGIETREQFETLRELGCPFGQGFWFSLPLTPNELVHRYLAPHRR